jgi:tetratricopeptide (TPR) repeat protein
MLFLLFALTAPSLADEPPVAMVLTTRGDVRLERGGETSLLGPTDLLRPADRLVAGDGELLLVILKDGHQERINARTRVTVQEDGCTPADAVERREAKLAQANLDSLRELARSSRAAIGVLRSSELPPAPQAVTPMYGARLLGDQPTLTWPAVARATEYRLQLLSGDGQRVLLKETTREPRLVLKPELLKRPNKYLWRVSAAFADKEQPLVNSKFALVTRAEADELAKLRPLAEGKEPAEWLQAAAAFEAHGVYDEALKLYERLAQAAPTVAAYQVALASYYERAGQADNAKASRERAKKLGAVLPGF